MDLYLAAKAEPDSEQKNPSMRILCLSVYVSLRSISSFLYIGIEDNVASNILCYFFAKFCNFVAWNDRWAWS